MTAPSSFFKVFGKEIPFYGMFFMTGLLLGGLLGALRCRKRGIPRMDAVVAACFTAVGGVLGAKILSVLTSINIIIEYNLTFMDVIRNGFVFYGGLIGGAIGMFIYCKAFKEDTLKYFDIFAVSVPIGHALGRVGCFFSGCCYGMEYHGAFHVVYGMHTADPNVPAGVPLLPIQLIEAFCLVGLYIILEILYFKTKKKGLCASIYFLTYASLRFTLEFFRGDKIRGIHGGLSTSQWISICIVIAWAVVFTLYELKKRKAALAPATEGAAEEGASDSPEAKSTVQEESPELSSEKISAEESPAENLPAEDTADPEEK